MKAVIRRITVFPIKSLDPVEVSEAKIAPGGGLELDRRWALFDEEGLVVNGKNDPLVHRLRARHDVSAASVELWLVDANGAESGPRRRFDLDGNLREMESWLSATFGRRVRCVRDDRTGFPDDLMAPGPTVISTGSLEAVASWYPGLGPADTRRRFRANLEIGGVDPFWEDSLFSKAGQVLPFRIGEVHLEGTNPCARCVVPARDPDSGLPTRDFQKRFVERRRATLPTWADSSRFDHFYRLAVNTKVPPTEVGKVIRVGDPVRIGW